MFDEMFGDMEEQSKLLKEKLAGIQLKTSSGGGLVQVTGNAAREVTAVKISPDLLQVEEAEQLEDLLVIAINELLGKASEAEVKATEEMMRDLLPGLGGLGNLLG